MTIVERARVHLSHGAARKTPRVRRKGGNGGRPKIGRKKSSVTKSASVRERLDKEKRQREL